LEDERLDLLPADAEHGGNVTVRVVTKLEQHQRRALVRRQPLYVLHHLAQVLAPLDLVC